MSSAQRTRLLLGALGVVLLGAFIGLRLDSGILIPDQVCYFAYGSSLLGDGDVQFYNEFQQLSMPSRYLFVTPTCYVENLFSPGSALLWLPFQAPAFAIDRWRHPTALPTSPLCRMAAKLAVNLMGVIAVILMVKTLAGLYRSDIVASAMIGMLCGSQFFHYWLNDALMAHVPSLLLNALLVRTWLAARLKGAPYFVFQGIVIGFAVLIRSQNAVLLLLPLSDLWFQAIDRQRFKPLAARTAALAIGFFLVVQLQLVIWHTIYGAALATPSYGNLDWQHIKLGLVLFSAYHGLVSWTPLLLIAFVGLCLHLRRALRTAIPALLVIVCQCVLVAGARQWWMGNSFGARIFLDYLPLFALGFAEVCRLLPRFLRIFMIVLGAGWTLLLFLQADAGVISLAQYYPYAELANLQLHAVVQAPRLALRALRLPRAATSEGIAAVGLSVALLAACVFISRRWSRMPLIRSGSIIAALLVGGVAFTEWLVIGHPAPLPPALCQELKAHQWLPFATRIKVTAAVGETEYYLRDGVPEKALPALDEALRLDPGNNDVIVSLAQVWLGSRQWQRAAELLEPKLAAAGLLTPAPNAADQLTPNATAAQSPGSGDAMDSQQLLRLYFAALIGENRQEAAVQAGLRLISLGSTESGVYLETARLATALGKPITARDCLERLLRNEPCNCQAYTMLAALLALDSDVRTLLVLRDQARAAGCPL